MAAAFGVSSSGKKNRNLADKLKEQEKQEQQQLEDDDDADDELDEEALQAMAKKAKGKVAATRLTISEGQSKGGRLDSYGQVRRNQGGRPKNPEGEGRRDIAGQANRRGHGEKGMRTEHDAAVKLRMA